MGQTYRPVAVSDYANDLAARTRNNWDQNWDSNRPTDYFADRTNRNSIEAS
jgi:hypothetical protein